MTLEPFARHRRTQDEPFHDFWWTSNDPSPYIPTSPWLTPSDISTSSPGSSVISNSAIPSIPTPSSQLSTSRFDSSNLTPTHISPSGDVIPITTSVPVVISQVDTTFTSFSQTVFLSTSLASALPASETGSSVLQVEPVCIGHGVDAQSLGLISTVVVPTVAGIVLWLIFATIRPRYRQVYALREWFVQQDLRPRPLGRSFFAFLNPPVPLVPSIPSDVDDAGRSPVRDAELFPSDEALSQRTLWICFLMVLGWTILACAAFLPLYMVDTPCLADTTPASQFTGTYSVLQDMSLLRLLRLLDDGTFKTSTDAKTTLTTRAIVDGVDRAPEAKTRVIIATVLAIVLGVLPVLWKIIREFNKMVAYRQRWSEVHCQGLELGWLSARSAPGFVGWGEKRLKEFIVKAGLSSTFDTNNESSNGRSRRRRRVQEWSQDENSNLEVDIRSLFSIGDTTQLALLIDERDEILENLEIAETKYINSFKLSTPDPSIADFFPAGAPPPEQPPPVPPKPQISRPRPLGNPQHRRRRRGRNPAYGSSSLPPTSYVMPSQYYKLRGVEGVSGGTFTDAQADELGMRQRGPSLTDSFNQRVVGSRFQEVNRDSMAFGRLPIGSQIIMEKNGQMGPARFTESPLPDAAAYGPHTGHTSWDTAAFNEGLPPQQWWTHQPGDSIQEEPELELSEEWVDVLNEAPEAFEHGEEYAPNATPPLPKRRPRPPRAKAIANNDDRRETFPLRNRGAPEGDGQPPPHLRIQAQGPFVRPLSGLDHDDLTHIYTDINMWRAKLKSLNAEIADLQRECYNDIADGARVKGWLMVGRGLRFVPYVQLIEGRAKEDIRWDELQNEGGALRTLAYWVTIITVAILLGISLTAVAGLAVATAPEFAHYFPFFLPLAEGNTLAAGVATGLAAAVGMTLFAAIALVIIEQTGQLRNTASLSGKQLATFKAIFYTLALVGGIWLSVAGAVLFAFGAFSTSTPESPVVADGAIYMSAFAMVLLVNVAIIFPALLMLQPIHLLRVLRNERSAVTPRQRFRAVYPRSYNPSYAIGCCVLAVLLASAFSLIFPLVAPAALLLLLLTLIAHRFLIGYVYGRTRSQTGGLLQIWLLKRFGTILAFQPLVLGLIFLSRKLWIEGGVLCGTAAFVALFVEVYCRWRTRQPGVKSLSNIARDSIETFARTARPVEPREIDEESTSLVSSARNTRMRGSFASILDMMSLTLAVMPSPSQVRGPVPLETETLDDLTATERAARTHPDAPPHLPELPFADHAEEMAGILYAPELLAPPPVIWLPNDAGGIGRSEAFDLQRYHSLQVTLDVHSQEDVARRRSLSPANPRSRSPRS